MRPEHQPNAAQPRVQPNPPVRAFYLATVADGGPVNLVLLGRIRRDYAN
jgi:hypothetical protein